MIGSAHYKTHICVCGGGNLGHVIAGYLAAQEGSNEVSLLSSHPQQWKKELTVYTCRGETLRGALRHIASDPAEVIPTTDVVLLCLPGTAIVSMQEKIRPYLSPGAFVGSVFSSTGFSFEALKILPPDICLWGFQRVPFIARTVEYGQSAKLLGYRNEYHIAIERCEKERKELFRLWVEKAFGAPTRLLHNYLEASITNSNPLLHTSRLYTMFHSWTEGRTFPRNILFYEEWTPEAAELYIGMDHELFELLKVLPVAQDFLQPVLKYYESTDAESLCRKLSSIKGFKGILSPMKEIEKGKWVPDFESRYFTEDFGISLKYIWQLTLTHYTQAPLIDKVYRWGIEKIKA